ncbi:MAG: DUF3244 domain-containing protein [Bacteroidales bacterium]|nr:DUF3244 domain-containing protein [Bacteroidales bacterium]
MYKLKEMILMLCFILSGALCYAHGEARMENKKEGDDLILVFKEIITYGGLDKSNAITPTINGHVLTVVFNENLGQVSVEVATAAGASVQCLSVLTPNGLQVYIPNEGNYIVTFTLSNGDVYYGEFTVTD